MTQPEPTPTEIQRLGWETFKQKLLQLLATNPREWVAFHGETQAALHESKQEVYRLLQEQGIPLTEVVVTKIEPLGPPVDLRRPRRRARRQ
ncbi:MAG: hypothetical protein RI947_907 [Candidatus Parcubacteria bacterium]|jgi:hypothetical protein